MVTKKMPEVEPQFVKEMFGTLRDGEFGPPMSYEPADLTALSALKVAPVRISGLTNKAGTKKLPVPLKFNHQFSPTDDPDTTFRRRQGSSDFASDSSSLEDHPNFLPLAAGSRQNSQAHPGQQFEDHPGDQKLDQEHNARKRDRLRRRWHTVYNIIYNKIWGVSKEPITAIGDDDINATSSHQR